jgi:uncharacterized protein YidB (DUF937 family)
MGLIDVLNGMQNGPRGASGSGGSSGNTGSSGGGMSPITMAILGLLAYKAVRSFTGSGAATSTPGAPAPTQAGGPGGLGDILKNALGGGSAPTQAGGPGGLGGGLGDVLKNVLGGGGAPTQAGGGTAGGLGDILKGPLGGLLAGGAAGTVLSGGLNDLLKQFQDAGHGDVTKSWVGNGPNQTISPNDLAKALGADQISALSAHSGMSRDDLLSGLSEYLPRVVDHLTPDGRMPTDQEISRSL